LISKIILWEIHMPTNLPEPPDIDDEIEAPDFSRLFSPLLVVGAAFFVVASVLIVTVVRPALRHAIRNGPVKNSLIDFVKTPDSGRAFAEVMSECMERIYGAPVTVTFGGFIDKNPSRIETATPEDMLALALATYDLKRENSMQIAARFMMLPAYDQITSIAVRDKHGAERPVDPRLYRASLYCQGETGFDIVRDRRALMTGKALTP
jgi:hypothetical protein